MDYNNITFWAMNIPKELEYITEQFREETYKHIPEEAREGYELGVKNTISLLKQILDGAIEDVSDSETEKAVVYYDPDVEIGTEMDIKDVACWVYGV